MTAFSDEDDDWNSGTTCYAVSRFNAVRHGLLSRYAVLPWEDQAEFDALLAELTAEYAPQGPTERHLVEELATVMWRRQRVLLAEAAQHRRALHETLADTLGTPVASRALAHVAAERPSRVAVAEAVWASSEETAESWRDLEADQAMTEAALALLGDGTQGAYEAALAALREDTRGWWEEQLTWEADDYEDNAEPYRPTGADLQRFLETEVDTWYEQRRLEFSHRPLIRSQAFGQSLDPTRLERLARYETHLDRKLQRTLALLLKLQEMRRTVAASPTLSARSVSQKPTAG